MSDAIWAPQAQQDLAEIAYYIAVESARPATAERIIREAHDLANLIAANPEMGAARPEFGKNCRASALHKRWILLYRPAGSWIEVLRFVDAARDLNQLFAED